MKLDGFNISEFQRQSIRSALAQYGYAEEDFEWTPTQDAARGGDDRLQGAEAVYLTYKPTGFRRMYGAANWEAEFTEDLKTPDTNGICGHNLSPPIEEAINKLCNQFS